MIEDRIIVNTLFRLNAKKFCNTLKNKIQLIT